MDQLVADTSISKTSMYKHFRAKEELILAALQLRDRLFRDWMVDRIEEIADTPKGRILALFDVLAEWFATDDIRGCMFIKASAEFQDQDHPIRLQSAAHKKLIEAYVLKMITQAGLTQPAKAARQIMLQKEGAIIAAYVIRSETAAQDSKEAARTLLFA